MLFENPVRGVGYGDCLGSQKNPKTQLLAQSLRCRQIQFLSTWDYLQSDKEIT